MEYWTLAVQIITILALGYYYINRRFSYWSSRGIECPPAIFPFGHLLAFFLKGQAQLETQWLAQYGKIYGIYQGLRPRLTIADPELIKQVLVKDFAVFANRDVQRFEHDIWSNNLVATEDEQWRRIRAITSPSFTTGKLKGMHSLMNEAVQKLAKYFSQTIESGKNSMNIKEVITGFTIDVIASTSFATSTSANSTEGRSENAFLRHGNAMFAFKPWKILSFAVMPKRFNKLVGAELGFDLKPFYFFVDLARAIIKGRREEVASGGTGGRRNDLVQLMMDAFVYEDELEEKNYEKLTATEDNDEVQEQETQQKSNNNESIRRHLTENEIIANLIIFFVAGFETTATTISNVLYHLAVNPDVQDRLLEELTTNLDGLEVNSSEYFTLVNRLPYLEATIKETLRIAPPATRLARRVGIDGYKLAGLSLEKDTHIDIAAYAVHHPAEYYPEPERFNPDRFMPQNKHLITPYAYLPFGQGPRNCIGMRFAYQEIRLCLALLIRQFRFSPTPKTPVPLKYRNFGILTCSEIPLKVEKR